MLRGKTAIVTGASSGVGKATVLALLREGCRVAAVARGAEGLARLRAEAPEVETFATDAADPATASRLLTELKPELVVLAAGVHPRMVPVEEQTWESFSEPWNTDLKASFHFVEGALRLPLAPGSSVVLVSSGAAIQGSPLSGGYAGAKRMQWLLAGYAQKRADARKLGLRFLAVLPKQLIAGTKIADAASTAYGDAAGITAAEFMRRFEPPLTPDGVAGAILGGLRGETPSGTTAVAVTGRGVEPLA